MSSGFELGFVRALSQQLWVSSASLIFSGVAALCCMVLCSAGQSLNLVKSAVSMRLRPKRFVAFASFPKSHINPLFNLSSLMDFENNLFFLFIRFSGLVLEWSASVVFTYNNIQIFSCF